MSNDGPIINRVAQSGLITLNLEDYFPLFELELFDLKDYLFQGLILKEKDFRKNLKELNWEEYKGKHVAVFCSTDAIIPVWAYMLVTAYLEPHADRVFLGTENEFYQDWYRVQLSELDATEYKDQRVVIKGCSNKPVPASAYSELVKKLRPFAQSIMYGEPCSTVPIFKRPRIIKPQ